MGRPVVRLEQEEQGRTRRTEGRTSLATRRVHLRKRIQGHIRSGANEIEFLEGVGYEICVKRWDGVME